MTILTSRKTELHRRIASWVTIGLLFSTLNVLGNSESSAASTPGDKISLYLSAPFVQGSHASGAGTATETFDAMATGNPSSNNCPSSSAIGSVTFTSQGCYVSERGIYGGAISTSSSPVVGGSSAYIVDGQGTVTGPAGAGTNFMATPFYNSGGERSTTFDFGNPVKYVGLWWSGGNAGNTVRFFAADNTLIAELSSGDITSLLGNTPNPFPGTSTVATKVGGSHLKARYFGNPAQYASATPSSPATFTGDFIYAYLNLFLEGDLGVTKMQVAGPGFEFDNLTVSTVDQQILDNMVLVTEKSVPTITWAPNTILALSESPVTPSAAPVGSVPGTFTYSVANAGATGCTVNSSTGVITYTAIGNCAIRTSLAPTNTATAYPASKVVTFNISSNPPGIPGAPVASAQDGRATVAITAPTSGGAPASYLVTATPGGATCQVVVPATSCEITGLTNGTSYTFRSTATNASATSGLSPASNAVTPQAAVQAPAQASASTPVQPQASSVYSGPIPRGYSLPCLPEASATSVTLVGQRLQTITSASINGQTIVVSQQSPESVQLALPALGQGTYDIEYGSVHGRLIHQSAISVCAKPSDSTTVVVDSKPVEPATNPFFVSKRFTSFKGDKSPVFKNNRLAIEEFVRANPGLTKITCVGSTSGREIPGSDLALATARAKSACDVVRKLVPGVEIRLATNVGKGTGKFHRAVTLFGVGDKRI
jgi:hypothetical protein